MHAATEQLVRIPVDAGLIEGALECPPDSQGLVLFAHGSGSSRHSPRNNHVARVLRERGLATLLVDLLTPEEDRVYATRFDIPLLTQRLLDVTDWSRRQPATALLPMGYFGASTGAAAALSAPFPPERRVSPARSSYAASAPVDAPEGTAARWTMPSSRSTSTSTVGFPRESRISRAPTASMSATGVLLAECWGDAGGASSVHIRA